jgi:hypothetical protein
MSWSVYWRLWLVAEAWKAKRRFPSGMTTQKNDNKKGNRRKNGSWQQQERLQRIGLINRLNRVATGCRLFFQTKEK